ncbi:MAG: hypothetical protein Q7T03_02895 [Deltaproteobacteria bacterium]|nr:hypothetical protein [Deltaproteobacteria bacterium]
MNLEPLITETAAGALFNDAIHLEKVRSAHRPLVLEQKVADADGNTAAAYACLQMWRSVLFAGFPITPSTKWLETVTSVVRSGKVGIKQVKIMEAEHAVADYMAGVAAACRDLIVSSATSSVGLDHMTESIRSLGASGLGNLILVNVYRATANYPLCIEGDPSDTLAHRDDGWIQICCRGVQQIYDTILQAPCLGMHPEILTPVMPGFYGIKDSHRSSRLMMEADSEIHAFQDRWISPSRLPGLINGDTAMGNCVTSNYFQGFKIDQKKRLERVIEILPEIGKDFEKIFGRSGLDFVEKIYWPANDKVDLAIIGMGPDIGTAAALAKEEEKKRGIKIGVLAARLLTPFPKSVYAKLLRYSKTVLILNQAFHYGSGHLALDLAEACYPLRSRPTLVNCFAGLGGAVVSDETWRTMIRHALEVTGNKPAVAPPIVVHDGRVVWPQ